MLNCSVAGKPWRHLLREFRFQNADGLALALQIMLEIRGWTDGGGYRQNIQQDHMRMTRSTDQMMVHPKFGK